MKLLQNHDKFKLLFSEIVKGRSYSPHLNCYIAHVDDLEYGELLDKKRRFLIIDHDIPSEEEVLENFKREGVWTDKDEDDMESLELVIVDNEKLIPKMKVAAQRDAIQSIIDGKKLELQKFQERKEELLATSFENHSAKFMSESILQHFIFKDSECKQNLYTPEEFDYLDDTEVNHLNEAYYDFVNKFNERNIRILATMPFLLNQISFCKKNITTFLNKSIAHFTHYQMSLVSNAIRNLNVLENSEADSPEITDSTDVQELLDWYDQNYSIWQSKLKSGSDSIGVTKTKNYVKA